MEKININLIKEKYRKPVFELLLKLRMHSEESYVHSLDVAEKSLALAVALGIGGGDFVVIVNASKAVFTGKKLDNKIYRYHTGYAGGLKEITYRKLMATKSEFAFREAVRRMLPKGPLGYKMAKKLYVYAGPEHNQQAQKPVELKL